MTLVNKIIEVSGVQFCNSSFVYCIVCSPFKVKFLSSPFILPLPSSTSPPTSFSSGNHYTVVCAYEYFLCLISSYFSPSNPNSHPFLQLSVCFLFLWVYFYIVCLHLFYSLDSTNKWNRMILAFLWLAYFSTILSRSTHAFAEKIRFPSFSWLSNNSLCKCTTVFLSTLLLMDTWAVSKFG